MNWLKLSPKVRFRREGEVILLCDLGRLRDFEIPLACWPTLDRLKHGFYSTELREEERPLVEDLQALGLLRESSVSPRIWESLEFE